MRRWLPLLLLAIAIGAAFSPSLRHGFVDWDDNAFLLGNPLIRAPLSASLAHWLLTPQMGYPIPVAIGLESLLWHVDNGAAWPFHLASLVLHMANAGLVLALARRLGASTAFAALAALLFGLHPLTAEPVAWATGFKDVSMATAALGATWAFLRWRQSPRAGWLWLAGGLAVASVLCKPGTVLWAGGLLAWLETAETDAAVRGRVRGLVIAILACAIPIALIGQAENVQTQAPDPAMTGVLQAPLALGHQICHALWPVSLQPRYFLDRAAGFRDPLTWLGLAALAGFLALLWRVRRLPGALGLWLAAATYLPVSNLLPFHRFLADSYAYLPLACLAFGLAPLLSARLAARPRVRRVLGGVAVVAILASGSLTFGQCQRWANGDALWQPVVARWPAWPEARVLLAQGRDFDGRHAQAAAAWAELFRADYPQQYLSALAASLAQAGALEDAECVFAEDVQGAHPTPMANGNLAAFLVSHPGRAPAYPEAAARALAWARAQDRRQPLAWPEPWRQTLRARPDVPVAGPPAPWPQRRCPVFQRLLPPGQ